MNIGKWGRLFLAEGRPGGWLTAKIMNWTGHVGAAPRSVLDALLTRTEAVRTGVYIVLGDDPDSLGGRMVSIGQGDDVLKGLYWHVRSEVRTGTHCLDRAIVLTIKDANLTEAHARQCPDGASTNSLAATSSSAPGAAAAVVAGRSADGRTDLLVRGTRPTYGQ